MEFGIPSFLRRLSGTLLLLLRLATLAGAQPVSAPAGTTSRQEHGGTPEPPEGQSASNPADPTPVNPWRNVTFGATLEAYYQYDWNQPPDRVIPLRAYDTRANTFGIQQMAFVVDASLSLIHI